MTIKECKNLLKNKNNQLFAVILIIGVVLISVSGFSNDTSQNSNTTDSSEAMRLEKILSDIKGAGDVSVMITYYEGAKNSNSEKNKAKGAVVTASGCSDPTIKSALSDAVCAALNLPAHKVCVYSKK